MCEGSYDTFEDAQENAEGKYVFNVDDKFNVIASIHTKEEDARALLTNAKNALITLTLDGVSIKITGTQAQKAAITEAVSLMAECATALPTLDEKLTSGKMTVLQAFSKITALKRSVSDSIDALASLNSTNHTVSVLNDMLILSLNLLEKIDEENLHTTLKYVACAYVCEYFCFLSELE